MSRVFRPEFLASMLKDVVANKKLMPSGGGPGVVKRIREILDTWENFSVRYGGADFEAWPREKLLELVEISGMFPLEIIGLCLMIVYNIATVETEDAPH
jgi:hypothetical protein